MQRARKISPIAQQMFNTDGNISLYFSGTESVTKLKEFALFAIVQSPIIPELIKQAKSFPKQTIMAIPTILPRVPKSSIGILPYISPRELTKRVLIRVPKKNADAVNEPKSCLLYTSPSPRDLSTSRMPSSA
eukprot:TRINITY_DN674_c0_g1_i2.p2 TRINITY_DN674_c0_g1~~TRINITY_DN674_c0_g1_i2.p2  ORF type:complete len:132 (+),score=50.67 TRINITY_DN674_c0_g1_i2:128-523(+)